MRRVLLLVTFLLALGAQFVVPIGAQQLASGAAAAPILAMHSPHPYCGGMPHPC